MSEPTIREARAGDEILIRITGESWDSIRHGTDEFMLIEPANTELTDTAAEIISITRRTPLTLEEQVRGLQSHESFGPLGTLVSLDAVLALITKESSNV